MKEELKKICPSYTKDGYKDFLYEFDGALCSFHQYVEYDDFKEISGSAYLAREEGRERQKAEELERVGKN